MLCPGLVPPDPRLQPSFLAAVDEIRRVDGSDRFTGLGVLIAVGGFAGESFTREQLADPATFAAYTQRLLELSKPGTWLPPGIVPFTRLWWVEGEEYLGMLSIRHSLTPWLQEFGGHIGYVVRPSARGRGHATAMLRASLPAVHGLGIDPALVTCDDTNTASRRTIEAGGGVFEDQRADKLRYWVPTS
ncbi:MAG: GNAT family N-acetyltransferase [Nocardioidaceae bacterium]